MSLALLFQLNLSPAHALVKLGPEIKTDIKGVKLSESAKIDDATPALNRVTQGLRQKKVVFAWFSVYVAQIFSTSTKPDFTSISNLKEALIKGLPVVVSMTFVRDVGIDKIVEGFKEVFEANKMDPKKAPYSDFLDAIQKSGDEVKDRQNFFFAFNQTAGKESFSVQTNGKEIYTLMDQAPGATTPFFNMWLGKPVDSGLEQLQDQLLKPNP